MAVLLEQKTDIWVKDRRRNKIETSVDSAILVS